MATAVHSRPPSTAGLTSSQSQNSAPVFEYRCMFTHDVRKKAKKWHDGSLRFHTFNKRVMVYDDTKNLVGSLHYRSEEDFDEGLELNLDSHVLVQVEEKLSESSTDLTPLLSRQKQDGTNNFVRPDPPTRATLSRINAANSQIKPKSIKELLAGSQGSIGRARLPNKSPYEERHPLTETQPPEPEPEPQPKRRRIVSEKENDIARTQSVQPLRNRRASIVLPQPSPPSEIVDISSDDETTLIVQNGGSDTQTQPTVSRASEPVLLPSNTTSAAKRSLPPAANDETKRQKKNQQPRSELPLSRPEKATSEKPAKNLQKTRRELDDNFATPHSMSPSIPSRSTADAFVTQIRHPIGPRSSLIFATGKPRPKLMYRALLADSSKAANGPHSTAATDNSAKDGSIELRHDDERQPRRPRTTHMIDTDRLFAPSQLGTDVTIAPAAGEPSWNSSPLNRSPSLDFIENEDIQMTPRPNQSSSASSGPNEETPETIPDSPLFLPRAASQVSPLPSQNLAIDDSHVSFLSQAVKSATSRRSTSTATGATPLSQSPARVDSPERSPTPPSSFVFHRLLNADARPDEPVSDSNPTIVDKPVNNASISLLAGDKTSFPLPPAQPGKSKLFRRVVSENFQPISKPPERLVSQSDGVDRSPNGLPEKGVSRKSLTQPERLSMQPPTFSNPVELRPPSPVPLPPSSSPDIDDCPDQEDVNDASKQRASTPEAAAEHISMEESGPWTSTEAFLLFDWWPQGRQKPSYAANRSAATSESGRGENNDLTRKNQSIGMKSLSKKYGTFGSAKFVSQR